MDIGQVFIFEGDEFAIKRVILPGGRDEKGNTYDNGRVDASKFVGEGPDRRIQKGRPKMFDYPAVAEILGEDVPESIIPVSITEAPDWRGESSNPEAVRKFYDEFTPEPEQQDEMKSGIEW